MLRRLLVRDWLLHGRMLLISYGLFAAFQVYFILRTNSTRHWLVFASVYATFLAISVFAREDRFQSTAWTCTLPVSRREVVRARFVGAWILVTTALVGSMLMAAVIPGSIISVTEALQPATLLLAATATSLVIALVLPFLIRFGLLGLLIFLVAAQVLGSAALVLAIALDGGGGAGKSMFSFVTDAVRATQGALTPAPFYLLVAALLMAVNWVGYRFAVRLFTRREL